MKQNLLKVFALVCAMFVNASAWADGATLNIEPFQIAPGATEQVTIDLVQGDVPTLGFQFELSLPEGLSLAGKPAAVAGTLTDEWGDPVDPTVTYSNGKFVVYNSEGLAFNADAKAIVTIKLKAAETFVNGTITLQNIVLSAQGNVKITPADVTVKVNDTTPAPTKYAVNIAEVVNGTLSVDKTEATAGETVKVTATPAEGYELDAVTVTTAGGDAVELSADFTFTMPAAAVTVSATFNKVQIPVVIEESTLAMSNIYIPQGETKQVNLKLHQDGKLPILGFQCEFEFPEWLALAGKPAAVAGTLTDEWGDAVTPTVTYSNNKIVVYNSEGLAFNADAVYIVTLKFKAAETVPDEGVIKIKNIILSGQGNVKLTPADVEVKVNTKDGIADIRANETSDVYTISGTRVNAMTRGLYIVNGKKVVVK